MRKTLFVGLLVIMSFVSSGQTMEAGFFAGISYYNGDLNPSYQFLQPDLAYGGLLRYNQGTRWSFKLNGYYGKVKGSDQSSNTNENRQLSFESHVLDLSATVEFNFFDYFTGSKKDNWSPYIFGGMGIFTYNPKADGIELRAIGTEGQNVGFAGRSPYGKVSFAIPFGIGFKFSINRKISAALEWGLRRTFTDYLDDVSTTYYLDGNQIDPANSSQVLSDPTMLHQPYQERGNPETFDWYGFAGLTLTYKFNLFGNRRCPDQQR